MLDQNADEALHRAEDRAVQHHRRVPAAILADIRSAEPLGHVEIELQGAALPVSAERVAQDEFELGAIEGALARIVGVSEASLLDRSLKVAFGAIPQRVAAGPMRRPVGELDWDIVEAEILVNREQQLAERDRL